MGGIVVSSFWSEILQHLGWSLYMAETRFSCFFSCPEVGRGPRGRAPGPRPTTPSARRIGSGRNLLTAPARRRRAVVRESDRWGHRDSRHTMRLGKLTPAQYYGT